MDWSENIVMDQQQVSSNPLEVNNKFTMYTLGINRKFKGINQ